MLCLCESWLELSPLKSLPMKPVTWNYSVPLKSARCKGIGFVSPQCPCLPSGTGFEHSRPVSRSRRRPRSGARIHRVSVAASGGSDSTAQCTTVRTGCFKRFTTQPRTIHNCPFNYRTISCAPQAYPCQLLFGNLFHLERQVAHVISNFDLEKIMMRMYMMHQN